MKRGEILAHPDPQKVIRHLDMSEHALVKEALLAKTAQGVKAFELDDGSSMLGAYGKVPEGQVSVLTQIPQKEALKTNRELIRRSIFFAAGILIAAFTVSVLFSRLLTAPIWRLADAAEVIGQGRFDVAIDVKTGDEIGSLARSFERMAARLKQTQAQLIRTEKMAAFGQLGAGITHEVKNPMTGILGFSQLGQQAIDDKQQVMEFLQMIESESKRCSEILTNFLTFARQDVTDQRGTEEINVNHMIQEVARLVSHQLMIHNVKLELELGQDLGPIEANAAEMHQVLVNLAINAQQAMEKVGGVLSIATHRDTDRFAVIEMTDNGPGIPADIRDKIFEPFFTTKAPGEGTGLGLSIVFGIVSDYGGAINVFSEEGRGTTFSIKLPTCGNGGGSCPTGCT